jgi:protein-tyrosine phosphatase
MFGFSLRRRSDLTPQSVRFDLHSHLIPGVDDGVRDEEEALGAIAALVALGYHGAVTTPHIHQDVFPNREANLLDAFAAFEPRVRERFPSFRFQMAAEYYVDNALMDRLDREPKTLLRFGAARTFMLIEFPMITLPTFTEDCLIACQRLGITPIIAHPERYADVQLDRTHERVRHWRNHGALIQVNLGSIVGQYESAARTTARALGDAGLVDFVGSDLHRPIQARQYTAPAWKALGRCKWDFRLQHHHRLF